MQYWLMKSEPDVYGIDDLIRDKVNMWEGCRNYTVRNYLRDEMQEGDLAFFYHSNIPPTGVVGIMRVVHAPYPDPTQFDPQSEYHDPKSPKDQPRWFVRDVEFVEKFARVVSLAEMKATPGLEAMPVTQKGQRLSITKVSPSEWDLVCTLGRSNR
ncbi:MAG TPA: EVE domain-containing protein [Fimbriimonadaceae bacterium]|nr:EVE domain-containing protein [Fimbriimonadaceae bacterium]